MSTKDFFSGHSKVYAAFRPSYPEALYQFIFKHLQHRSIAWDCATGNGQVAQYLAGYFEKVYATDISAEQLVHAFPGENIFYSESKAEQTSFPDSQFDLITVAQALHWINTDEFYREARRVGRQHALLAVWGYALLTVDPQIDRLFLDFYHHQVGPYWDSARRLVEERYENIPFPFTPIATPDFKLVVEWSIGQFAGYITSWSATQKYIKTQGHDPVPAFIETIRSHWKDNELRTITFPVFMKLGKVHS
jgi:SAM-dependent methyltransferase